MTVVTYSKARQNLSTLLNMAANEGEVVIRRQDGRLFSLRPQVRKRSPFAVKGVRTRVTTQDILECIRQSRRQA
jgi:hypothetical protein